MTHPDHAGGRPAAPIRERPALRFTLLSVAAIIVAGGAAFAATIGTGQFAVAPPSHPAANHSVPTPGKGG